MMRNQKPFISVILPCLNEEKTIARAISWAKQGLQKLGPSYRGEIIVVDNGSADNSVSLARRAGAYVLIEPQQGYGQAYRTGLAKAKGIFLILGDSDGTYDFRHLHSFVKKLEHKADLVLGTRLKGTIKPGAMSFSHRFVGTPILTAMLNVSYGTHISDAQSGMRALTQDAYQTMKLKSTGMEFASEMIVKAIYHGLKIEEVPISYYPRLGRSKLSPFSDAWRHIKVILLFAPTYALVLPGTVLLLFGAIITAILTPKGTYLLGWFFDIHTMMMGILAANLGLELVLLGVLAKVFTNKTLKLPSGPLATFLIRKLTVERLLLGGVVFFLTALGIIGWIALSWVTSGFPDLAAARVVLFATGLGTIGAQCMFASLLYGLLNES